MNYAISELYERKPILDNKNDNNYEQMKIERNIPNPDIITFYLHLIEEFKSFCFLNLKLIRSQPRGIAMIREYLKRV